MNFDAAAGPSSAARADGAGCPVTDAPPDGSTDRVASEEAILSRAKAVFLAERGAQASGLGAAASQPTLRLILAADVVRGQLWSEHGDAVRQQFAPELIDKQEVFGYLLNDLFGKPLLHKDYARAVGQRGDNAVLKAKTKLMARCAASSAEQRGCSPTLARRLRGTRAQQHGSRRQIDGPCGALPAKDGWRRSLIERRVWRCESKCAESAVSLRPFWMSPTRHLTPSDSVLLFPNGGH